MAHAKKFLFSDEEQLFSAYCKAMGHPARWRILKALLHGEVRTAHMLTKDIPLSAATIQNHLIRLQRIQLIELGTDSGCDAGFRLSPLVYEDMISVVSMMVEKGR